MKESDNKSKILWVVITMALVLGLFFLASGGGGTVTEFPLGSVVAEDHMKGSSSSTVVFTEYSDFQCPACKSFFPILREVNSEYGDRIRFVYRHFPLITIHPNAEDAARASEAAGLQGKFWEMHDLLFEKQNEWSGAANPQTNFEEYAKLLNLDIEKFRIDYESETVAMLVKSSRVGALKIGVNSTPTFYLGGKKLENVRTITDFKKVLDEALAQ